MNIEFEINPKIVRGLDYYTKTVFEFITTSIGAQGTVCGGGRYDGLIEQLGGKPLPALGFAMGIERLILTMENQGCDFIYLLRSATFISHLWARLLFLVQLFLQRLLRDEGFLGGIRRYG